MYIRLFTLYQNMNCQLCQTSDVLWINANQILAIRHDPGCYQVYLVGRNEPITVKEENKVYFANFKRLIKKSQISNIIDDQ